MNGPLIKVAIMIMFNSVFLDNIVAQKIYANHVNDVYQLILNDGDHEEFLYGTNLKLKLLDFRIVSKNNVLIITKEPMIYRFYDFERINNAWVKCEASGDIAGFNDQLSCPDNKILSKQPNEKTFKILDDNTFEYFTNEKEHFQLSKQDLIDQYAILKNLKNRDYSNHKINENE